MTSGTHNAPSQSGFRRNVGWLAFAGALAIVMLAFAARFWAVDRARSVTDAAAAEAARANAGLLVSELQKFRVLPLVLTEYADVTTVLEKRDVDAIDRLNKTLELLADRTDAAVIYVLDREGKAIAASNWNGPDTFVGHDYRYRPYFSQAMRTGAAEFFALGAVSSRPGLFIASRIVRNGVKLGVVVLKVEFDRIEAAWRLQTGQTIVSDHNGVIIITSRPEWRFRTLTPLTAKALAATRESQQFGDLTLRPVDVRFDGADATRQIKDDVIRYRNAVIPIPLDGGALHALQPLAPAEANAQARARAVVLVGIIVVALAFGLLVRSRERARLQADARRQLEEQVTLRTAELTEANRLLVLESREREEADRRYRKSREETHQANRLATIGQITAGVAHEINQPIAAIRTFAENARVFLDRNNTANIRDNLTHIVDLTARVGAITAHLRSFARRSVGTLGPVEVEQVIDGALMLVGDRMRTVGIELEHPGPLYGLAVRAERIRLEQVLVNLLQNAVEALEGFSDPRVRIVVEDAPVVAIEVHDSGAGLSSAIADDLFTPFVTGRPEGLGLGLGIARDIAREFGGELVTISSSLGGAAFRLTLRRI